MALRVAYFLYFYYDISSFSKQQINQCLMQQKVLLTCKIYLFCIYFSLNDFNYPHRKLAIPSELTKFFRESFATIILPLCTPMDSEENIHEEIFSREYIHFQANYLTFSENKLSSLSDSHTWFAYLTSLFFLSNKFKMSDRKKSANYRLFIRIPHSSMWSILFPKIDARSVSFLSFKLIKTLFFYFSFSWRHMIR